MLVFHQTKAYLKLSFYPGNVWIMNGLKIDPSYQIWFWQQQKKKWGGESNKVKHHLLENNLVNWWIKSRIFITVSMYKHSTCIAQGYYLVLCNICKKQTSCFVSRASNSSASGNFKMREKVLKIRWEVVYPFVFAIWSSPSAT